MESQLIRFFCCYCSERIRVDARLSGKQGRCPKCTRVITIPADVESDIRSSPAALKAPLDRDLAETQRCESCGMVLSSIATACPACGNELYRKSGSSYVDDLRRQLAEVEAETLGLSMYQARDNRKSAIIEMFTVPNNRDAILELLSLSASNGDRGYDPKTRGSRAAWRAKAKQMLGKAQVFAARDSEYRRILAPFEATINSWPARERKESMLLWIGIALGFGAILAMIFLTRNMK